MHKCINDILTVVDNVYLLSNRRKLRKCQISSKRYSLWYEEFYIHVILSVRDLATAEYEIGKSTVDLFDKKKREKPKCAVIIIYHVWTLIGEIPE